MEDLTCPSCSKEVKVDTANDLKVKCPYCQTFLKVVVMLDGNTVLAKVPSKTSAEQMAALFAESFKDAKAVDDPTWRSFVVQRNRQCAGCDKTIKKYQCAYGLIENSKVTRIVCMDCNSKSLPPDEENPLFKLGPKIVKRP
jgi:hypothetical protein